MMANLAGSQPTDFIEKSKTSPYNTENLAACSFLYRDLSSYLLRVGIDPLFLKSCGSFERNNLNLRLDYNKVNVVPLPNSAVFLTSFAEHNALERQDVNTITIKKGKHFVESLFRSFLFINGLVYKNAKNRKRAFIDFFISLLHAHENNSIIAYTRKTVTKHGKYNAMFARFFATKGYAFNLIGAKSFGIYGSDTGITSWSMATPALIAACELNDVVYSIKKEIPLVIIRDANKKDFKNNDLKAFTKKDIENAAKPVIAHNDSWKRHTATFNDKKLNPFAKRVFNQDLDHGGRFYCPFQNMPSADRANILIDGEKTVELDYKAIHINILYSLVKMQLKGDPYTVAGIERKVMKLLMLRLVNSNVGGFKSIITKSSKPENKAIYAQYEHDLLHYEHEKEQGNECVKPLNPFIYDSHETFIPGIPDGLTGDDVYKIITDKHRPIAHLFGAENLGTRLQNIDSSIMAEILMNLAKQDIAALPVHDSVIVKLSDQAIANDVMKKAYLKIMKHDIDVTTK